MYSGIISIVAFLLLDESDAALLRLRIIEEYQTIAVIPDSEA